MFFEAQDFFFFPRIALQLRRGMGLDRNLRRGHGAGGLGEGGHAGRHRASGGQFLFLEFGFFLLGLDRGASVGQHFGYVEDYLSRFGDSEGRHDVGWKGSGHKVQG